MDVDNDVMDMLRAIAIQGRFTTNQLRRAAGQEPGEPVTTGDMTRLGQMFRDKVLDTVQLIVARRLEADEDATRRRTEMAANTDNVDKR